MRLGQHEIRTLVFAYRNAKPGQVHGYNRNCRATVRAIRSLDRKGLIEWWRESEQFAITEQGRVVAYRQC